MLQVINSLEEAEEQATEVFVSSWDTRRAFDSPAKQALVRSWTRLGIPDRIAKYLVDIDKFGLTMLKSDLAEEVEEMEGRRLFEGGKEGLPVFRGKRGAGQGDVTSPLNWDCLYDILLRALEIGGAADFLFRITNERLAVTPEQAYADDLLSIAARVETLQRKADIVSAFMITFQLTIVPEKLRLLWFDFKREQDRRRGREMHIRLHGPDWVEMPVEVRRMGSMKYLGCVFDGRNDGRTQLGQTMATVRRLLNMITRRKASAGTKAVVTNMCVVAKACYTAKFGGWSLEQMKKIEREFGKAYKKMTKNMRSYPAELLYVSKMDGGLGFPNFLDRVMATTWSMLARALKRRSGGTCEAAHALLERPLRGEGLCTLEGLETEIRPQEGGGAWATSLLRYMGERGVSMMRGGGIVPGELLPLEGRRVDLGINRVQDRGEGGTVELVQGQLWWDYRDNWAIELVGRDNGGRWSVRIWEPVRVGRGGLEPRELEREARRSRRHKFPPRGLALVLQEGSECYGGGTKVMMDVSRLFTRGTGTRVIVNPDRAVGARLVTEVVDSFDAEVDEHRRGRKVRFYDGVMEGLMALPNPVIVTDGSFWREG
jgi:hypothetical protein